MNERKREREREREREHVTLSPILDPIFRMGQLISDPLCNTLLWVKVAGSLGPSLVATYLEC